MTWRHCGVSAWSMTTCHRASWMTSWRRRHVSSSRLMLSWNDCVDSEATETAVSRLCVRMLAAWKLRATGINDRFVQMQRQQQMLSLAGLASSLLTTSAPFFSLEILQLQIPVNRLCTAHLAAVSVSNHLSIQPYIRKQTAEYRFTFFQVKAELIIMPPPLIGGGIKRWCCLTSVCRVYRS